MCKDGRAVKWHSKRAPAPCASDTANPGLINPAEAIGLASFPLTEEISMQMDCVW